MGEFAVSIERSKAKSISASGGFAPLNPGPGALPLDPAGGSAPDPRYRLSLCALAMDPPLPNPKYATAY